MRMVKKLSNNAKENIQKGDKIGKFLGNFGYMEE